MFMPQKICFFLFFVLFSVACRQKNVEEPIPLSYPPAPLASTAMDSTYAPPIPVPFDGLYAMDSLQKREWLTHQIQISDSLLLPSPFFYSNWRSDRLAGFPQQIGHDFYSLGYLGGQHSLLKGNDLSTLAAYEYFIAPNRLPADYFIQDFHVFSPSRKVALLLADSTGSFTPALWLPENDSLHIWQQLKVKEQWWVDAEQQKLLVSAAAEPYLYEIDLSIKTVKYINIPFSHSDHLSIAGQLDKGTFLIKRQAKRQPVQFWAMTQNDWSLLFEFTPDPYTWLGSIGDQHYFLSDFKSGQPEIFATEKAPAAVKLKSLVQSGDTLIMEALLTQNGFYTLEEKDGKSRLRQWSLGGQLLAQYPLPEALQVIDLSFYPESGTVLVRQIDAISGMRYLAINPDYTQAVEIVHQTLADPIRPLEGTWRTIRSYDGTNLPICLVHSSPLQETKAVSSLFIPLPNRPKDLLQSQMDLALANRLLNRGGVAVFIFPRGNRRLGKAWYQAGTGPQLQLAFDDLQATLSYCNQQQIGAPDRRSVWAVAEQALNGGALLVQRPDLSQSVFLDQGSYDLRPESPGASPIFASPWWYYQDSIPGRLIRPYSPLLAEILTNNGPRTMVQSTNPYIFEPAAVFLARLQAEMPQREKLWAPPAGHWVKRADLHRRKWESKLDAFLYKQ